MSGGDAPNMPSPAEQSQANIQQAASVGKINMGYNRQQVTANRPTQITPWGTTSWNRSTPTATERMRVDKNGNVVGTGKYDLNQDNWTQTTTLDPKLQAALDAQQGINKQISEAAAAKIPGATAQLGTQLDPTQAGLDRASAVQSFYDRMLPAFNQNEASVDAQLAAQGLSPSSEAWNRTKDQIGRMRNDLFATANLQGDQTYNNTLKNTIALRELPFQELQGMLSGNQVQMPNFSGFSQMAGTSSSVPDMSSLMQNSYQSDLANYNANQAQNGQIASGIMTAIAMY